MAVVLAILTVLVILSIEMARLHSARRAAENAVRQPIRRFADVHFPCGLFLGEGHTWARLTESGEFKVGADELITQALGGTDQIDLPQVGSEVTKGGPLAKIRRFGRQLVVPSPVDGTIVSTNDTVKRSPAAFGADPYGCCWLATVWPVEHSEALQELRVGQRATKWLERELQRFSEFLSLHTQPEQLGAILPDGSTPVIGSALALGDDDWEEFQRQFTGIE